MHGISPTALCYIAKPICEMTVLEINGIVKNAEVCLFEFRRHQFQIRDFRVFISVVFDDRFRERLQTERR